MYVACVHAPCMSGMCVCEGKQVPASTVHGSCRLGLRAGDRGLEEVWPSRGATLEVHLLPCPRFPPNVSVWTLVFVVLISSSHFL